MPGGTNLNLKTVEDMERIARGEADGCCSKRLQGKWLEAWYDDALDEFTWRFGQKQITRQQAQSLLNIEHGEGQ